MKIKKIARSYLMKKRTYFQKLIPPDKLCQCCQRHEIAPWSNSYCAKCHKDTSDFDEEGPKMDYWTRRRRGIIKSRIKHIKPVKRFEDSL